MAAGRWLVAPRLKPMLFSDHPLLADAGIVCGVYLITDEEARVRWLGQASRSAGLLQRLADHDRDEARHAVFATVRILHLDDHTPPLALDAIEGRCADLLELRGRMGSRRWPSSANWPAAVV
ncbi:hypothetical protein ACWEVP_35850 [Amycolatopsis sp. NPDC003865]